MVGGGGKGSDLATATAAFCSLSSSAGASDALAAFVAEVGVLPFDEAAAQAYAAMPFRRGSFDRLIAAHALSLDAALVSRKLADFKDIPGLRVEDWTH